MKKNSNKELLNEAVNEKSKGVLPRIKPNLSRTINAVKGDTPPVITKKLTRTPMGFKLEYLGFKEWMDYHFK